MLQLGAYFIPKDTLIQINLWGMHHDERWWKDAESFKPERWLKDRTGGDRSGMAYMPFGLGPHNCVGVKLACKQVACVSLLPLFTSLFWFSLNVAKHWSCQLCT